MPPRRRHGLHPPFDPLQGVVVFAYTFFALAYFAIHAPLMTPSVFQSICTGYYCVGFALSVAAYVIAAVMPCHDVLLDRTYAESDLIDRNGLRGTHTCWECKSLSKVTSKHCRTCCKCVEDFDHHCRWLNHCVSDRNYTHFAVFLSMTASFLLLQSCLSLYYIVEFFAAPATFMRRVRLGYDARFVESDGGHIALVVFLFVVTVLQVFSALLIGHLWGFHIYLNIRGISTYDNIKENKALATQQRFERRDTGMADWDVSPRCGHRVAVWYHRRTHPTAQAHRLGDDFDAGAEGAGAAPPSPHPPPSIRSEMYTPRDEVDSPSQPRETVMRRADSAQKQRRRRHTGGSADTVDEEDTGVDLFDIPPA